MTTKTDIKIHTATQLGFHNTPLRELATLYKTYVAERGDPELSALYNRIQELSSEMEDISRAWGKRRQKLMKNGN